MAVTEFVGSRPLHHPDSPAADKGGATAQGEKRNYKKTLNLPKTTFPMKANLVQNEPATLKRWAKAGLAERIREARKGAPVYRFHDGPPYANGAIHMGHLLNKCMKDFVVRTRTMMGMDCTYIPGWDCHGLPIEHKVMSELVASGKMEKLASLDDDTRRTAIRKACQADAEKYIKLQAGQMQRLLTQAEYDTPYLTMSPEFEGATLEVFADLVEQGLVFRKLKSVHWSPANETALAEAELEYYDRDDLSVYVEFDAASPSALAKAFGLDAATFTGASPTFMIWTTTPWTLPANVLIAVGEKIEYALARVGSSLTVVAKEMVEGVAKREKKGVEILATAPGKKLVGLGYKHPFADPALGQQLAERDGLEEAPEFYRVVGADYVTTEDGTGLVHTAPGHGEDDYQTGLREGLPIYCPVRENGSYDNSVPEWIRGMDIFEANQVIHDWLKEDGRLFHSHVYNHSYPHDWRGKTPVIFRATEQWFIGVDVKCKSDGKTLRERAVKGASSVEFVPAWGRNRLLGMLEQRPDWCISRQRSWGLPIPAFQTPEGEALLTAASVRAVAKRVREKGSGCWLTDSPAELLTHYDAASDKDAPKGVTIETLTKMHDIFDVWFESGSSWHAVMDERGIGTPVDLYLEGSDQHRGWFQSSLLTRAGTVGGAPYKHLLTHGFMVAKDGRKMSKSLGNALDVDELMKTFGADVARWWVATLAYENDIKVDLSFIETAGEAYRKIRNTLRFMLSNLDDYVPSPPGKNADCGEGMCIDLSTIAPTSIDAWALSEFNELSKTVREAYERFDFKTASARIYDFCNDTLSAVYLAAVKDRLYCDKPDSARRRQTQNVLCDMTDGLCRLLAPIIPHTADEAYRALGRTDDDSVSVHVKEFIESFDVSADKAWPVVMKARDAALLAMEKERAAKGVENPLDAGVTLPDPDGVLAKFDAVDLADLLGVSRVTVDPKATAPVVQDLRSEPRCERSWKRDGTVKERSDGGMLTDRDAAAIGV